MVKIWPVNVKITYWRLIIDHTEYLNFGLSFIFDFWIHLFEFLEHVWELPYGPKYSGQSKNNDDSKQHVEDIPAYILV